MPKKKEKLSFTEDECTVANKLQGLSVKGKSCILSSKETKDLYSYFQKMYKVAGKEARSFELLSKDKYPMPIITKTRVVQEAGTGGIKFRCYVGVLEFCSLNDGKWKPVNEYSLSLTNERIKIWYDLIMNPTEEVEDDDSD